MRECRPPVIDRQVSDSRAGDGGGDGACDGRAGELADQGFGLVEKGDLLLGGCEGEEGEGQGEESREVHFGGGFCGGQV